MKKLLVLGLSMLAFAACKSNPDGGGTAEAESVQEGRRVETVYDIAYVQMDSLVNNYARYVDLSTAFEAKATKVQGDLEARARRLQNEMVDLEEKASKGLMTRSQIETTQTQIQQRANTFETDRQTRVAELAEEEQVMTNQVLYAITQYVAKYNADYRFKMILTTSGSAPILHADPALNITAEILKGLNAEYATEQQTSK